MPDAAAGLAVAASAIFKSAMTGPQIGFLDALVPGQFGVIAFRQHVTAGQHGDDVGQVGHHAQIMLDHQDGVLRRDPLDQCGDLVDVLMSHAGHRLVEQHHLRIERQRGGDLERRRGGKLAQADIVEQFMGAVVEAVEHGLGTPEIERATVLALQRQHGSSFDFWRSKSVLDRFHHRAHELLDDVGLSEFAATPALEIATTLALDPEMMLLDEPMAGMGHEDIDKIAALIKRISAKYTILMVEHNLSVVANLSDIITVLTRGHVLAEGNYAELSRDERVKEAYLGAGHG